MNMDNKTSQNDSAMSEHVISEVDERGVATVTLNRPEVHNAFDDVLINSLTQLSLIHI